MRLCLFPMLLTACYGFIINNIPYHRQINGVTCGDAVLEMIVHFHKSDINQKSIMDVMRSTFEQGTLSYDMIRGGHFSNISSSFWNIYPEYSLKHGWFDNSVDPDNMDLNMGNAAFMYRSTECWLDQLKNVLSAYQYPIGVLQYFDAQSESDGTHYRLVIGFNDSHIMMYDPWDRNGQPRTIHISNNEFCDKLWNYAETNGRNVTYLPYFGAFIAPFNISIAYHELNINASYDYKDSYYLVTVSVTYPCPDPFCGYDNNLKKYIAANTSIQLMLPPMLFIDARYENATVTLIGNMKPNETMAFHYYVQSNSTCGERFDGNVYHITAIVKGFINGQVPAAYKGGLIQEYIQGYHYSDVIGGVGQVQF